MTISNACFFLFFGILLAACGINIVDKPIQTIVILAAVACGMKLDKKS